MLTRTSIAILTSSLGIAACAAPEDNVSVTQVPDGPVSVQDQLASGASLAVVPEVSAVGVTARRANVENAVGGAVLAVLGGGIAITAQADGRLQLDELEVALDDVVVDPSDLPPHGLHLSGIVVRLEQASFADVQWSTGGDRAEGTAMLNLAFDWALVAGERVIPLATQHVSGVPVALAVEIDAAGSVLATLQGAHDGVFWKWADVLELADLSLALTAVDGR